MYMYIYQSYIRNGVFDSILGVIRNNADCIASKNTKRLNRLRILNCHACQFADLKLEVKKRFI